MSTTFHGRDIMAPVAARLSLGLAPAARPAARQLDGTTWPEVREWRRKSRRGRRVDSFGNLITNITYEMLAGVPTDKRARRSAARDVRASTATYERAAGDDARGPDRLVRPPGVGHRRRQRGDSWACPSARRSVVVTACRTSSAPI